MRVITFGTFDVLHIGHVRILEKAKRLGDYLIVGVSSDELNVSKKGRPPVYPLAQRLELVASLGCVDEVFVEESLEKKGDYIREYAADILVMGRDWQGKFDEFRELCDVTYLDRTPAISTTAIIELVKSLD